jgi:hypothetical protein
MRPRDGSRSCVALCLRMRCHGHTRVECSTRVTAWFVLKTRSRQGSKAANVPTPWSRPRRSNGLGRAAGARRKPISRGSPWFDSTKLCLGRPSWQDGVQKAPGGQRRACRSVRSAWPFAPAGTPYAAPRPHAARSRRTGEAARQCRVGPAGEPVGERTSHWVTLDFASCAVEPSPRSRALASGTGTHRPPPGREPDGSLGVERGKAARLRGARARFRAGRDGRRWQDPCRGCSRCCTPRWRRAGRRCRTP